jgi:peptidyl-prolyl cis-trans isomerase SurA
VTPAAAQTGSAKAWAAQTSPTKTKTKATKEPGAGDTKSAQSIVLLVNDEPITAYEIEQRARFMALNANIRERAEETFKRLAQSDNTKQQLMAMRDEVIRNNPGKSQQQLIAIFEERKKQLGLSLQKQAVESARASLIPGFRKQAQEELIEERLKQQAARALGIEISDDDIKRNLRGLAERNKMTLEQFEQHLKATGIDTTMRERMKANMAWAEVIRRRFAVRISVTHSDVDRLVSAAASEGGDDRVELQVQKITLAIPGRVDEAVKARRLAEADDLRKKFAGCKSLAGLAKDIPNAKFEDLKYVKPNTFAEPTRSLLLYAKDGDLLPPTPTLAGIEVYAVCGRRAAAIDDKQREKAQAELQQRQFEMLADRHLRDLKQDAHIEYR